MHGYDGSIISARTAALFGSDAGWGLVVLRSSTNGDGFPTIVNLPDSASAHLTDDVGDPLAGTGDPLGITLRREAPMYSNCAANTPLLAPPFAPNQDNYYERNDENPAADPLVYAAGGNIAVIAEVDVQPGESVTFRHVAAGVEVLGQLSNIEDAEHTTMANWTWEKGGVGGNIVVVNLSPGLQT